jgi:hypothetical protein
VTHEGRAHVPADHQHRVELPRPEETLLDQC